MKKTYVFTITGLMLTTIGMLSQLWLEELLVTYVLLGVGFLLCMLALYLGVKKRLN
ncbi:hypothetical protein [Marinilabilia sp.]